MSDKDQAWLDGLTGRGDGSPDAREAAALRRAVLNRTVEPVDAPERSRARERALLARARLDGLTNAPVARRWPYPPWTGWALAAGLVAAIGTGLLLGVPQAHQETVRGSTPTAAVVLRADDPLQTRYALVDALLDVGIDARGYAGIGRQIVEAELPTPVAEPVRRVLVEFGITVPEDGTLRVRIQASEP